METKINVTISQTLTPDEIGDLVSTALEGGINYWCGKAKPIHNQDKTYYGVKPEDQEKVQFISDLIGLGGRLRLFDAESDDKWDLTLEKFLKGLQMHCTKRGITPAQLMDVYDASDADCIIQYALFNELVFG